jgi:hypothetical protein
MDKLKGLLSLPFSRKFMAAILVPILFALNRKFSLGFSDAEVIGVSAAMVAFIVGTAMEDSKKESNGNGKPIAALLPVLLLLGLTSGCCSQDIKAEVRVLHKSHRTWRQNTVPKPDLSEADKKKVDALGDEMENSFDKLEKLTE